MEARLAATRSPAVALVFVLALTMLLVATIGYLLKPASIVAGPTRFIVMTTTQAASGPGECVYVNGHKGC